MTRDFIPELHPVPASQGYQTIVTILVAKQVQERPRDGQEEARREEKKKKLQGSLAKITLLENKLRGPKVRISSFSL